MVADYFESENDVGLEEEENMGVVIQQFWTVPPFLSRGVKTRFRFALSLCAFHFALLSKTRFISIFVSSYETAV